MNYKNLGQKMFRAGNLELAKDCFSLDYSQTSDEEDLELIDIVEFALQNSIDKPAIIECFKTHGLNEKFRDFFRQVTYRAHELEVQFSDSYLAGVIKYDDFKSICSKGGNFKEMLSNATISSHILIFNEDQLADFVENLIDHNCFDLAWNYLENSILFGDERLKKLVNQIKQKEAILK